MKKRVSYFFSISTLSLLIVMSGEAQTIDKSKLVGTWVCYKATEGNKEVTSRCKDHQVTFTKDSTYRELKPYFNNSVSGTYSISPANYIISYKNLVDTTYTDGFKDKIQSMRVEHESTQIFSLTKDELVLMIKKNPGNELPADLKMYYRRIK
jgi:hypothetical protein